MDDEKRIERFNHLMGKWIEYCCNTRVQMSQTARAVWNCRPYHGIVRLGPAVLPLVKQAYESDVASYATTPDRTAAIAYDVIRTFGLEAVVSKLTDGFSVPDSMRQDADKREAYTRGWLDNYLSAPSTTSTPPKTRGTRR